jgi:hypothetical protein
LGSILNEKAKHQLALDREEEKARTRNKYSNNSRGSGRYSRGSGRYGANMGRAGKGQNNPP